MLWVYGHYKYFTLSVQGSTLDVRRRQILTYKVGPLAERFNLTLGEHFISVVMKCCEMRAHYRA